MNVTTRITPPGMDEAEWKLRCDLAALYRLVAHYKMTDFIYTHISARIPGADNHFLINQYGVLFEDMRASDLVKIDLDGKIVNQDEHGSRLVNEAGFVIHSAIHAARHDLNFVRAGTRAAADFSAFTEILRKNILSRLRGDRAGARRAAAPGRRSGAGEQGDDPHQSRPARRREHRARGVHEHLLLGTRVPGANRGAVRRFATGLPARGGLSHHRRAI